MSSASTQKLVVFGYSGIGGFGSLSLSLALHISRPCVQCPLFRPYLSPHRRFFLCFVSCSLSLGCPYLAAPVTIICPLSLSVFSLSLSASLSLSLRFSFMFVLAFVDCLSEALVFSLHLSFFSLSCPCVSVEVL